MMEIDELRKMIMEMTVVLEDLELEYIERSGLCPGCNGGKMVRVAHRWICDHCQNEMMIPDLDDDDETE